MLSLNDLKKNIFKNIGIDKILIIVMVGILFLVITIPTGSKTKNTTTNSSDASNSDTSTDTSDYEQYLENKIQSILSKVDGVGKVDIMVTLKGTGEKVLVSEDTISENSVKETDSDGGVRESLDKSSSQSYLYSNSQNGSEPYVSQEIKPEVEGVVIIAQGGADSIVVSNITKAIEALLSVPAHKIQVLKMSD